MGIHDSLQRLASSVGALNAVQLRQPHFLDEFKKQETLLNGVFPREPVASDLEQLHEDFARAISSNEWSGFSERDWKNLPWVLWMDCGRELATAPVLRMKYVEYLSASRKLSALRTLIYVYLRDFPVDSDGIDTICRKIRGILMFMGPDKPFMRRWWERDRKFKLFSPHDAGEIVKKAILSSEQSVKEVLTEIGLTGELASTGLAREAYLAALKNFELEITGDGEHDGLLTRIFEWSLDTGELRYPACKARMVDTLLIPWVTAKPSESAKNAIETFLLSYLKDPRLHRGNWQGVDDRAMDVIYRWLTGATLRDFFEILSRTAQDSHWRYRKAFWTAYFEKGVLDNAWLALGTDALRAAKQTFGREVASAVLEGYGVQSNHSVMLMKIGNLIVAEWSHNGKCRVWSSNSEDAPKMSKKKYNRNELMYKSEKIVNHYQDAGLSHHGSEDGTWQGHLASFIYKKTGIRLSSSEYMRGVR